MLLVHACGQCHLNFEVIPVSLLGVLLCIETISIDFFFVCNSNSYYKRTKKSSSAVVSWVFLCCDTTAHAGYVQQCRYCKEEGKERGDFGVWLGEVQPGAARCSVSSPQCPSVRPSRPRADAGPGYSRRICCSFWPSRTVLGIKAPFIVLIISCHFDTPRTLCRGKTSSSGYCSISCKVGQM